MMPRICAPRPFLLPVCLFLFGVSASAQAQTYQVPPTYGGNLWSRPRLTSDWGAADDDLGKAGIVLDGDLVWMPQQIASGGKDHDGGSWGLVIATLNVDTQKLGMWPGGFIKSQTVTSFGKSPAGDTGAVVPANEAWLLPGIRPDTGLQSSTITQFLSLNFGLMVGKINTLDLLSNMFYSDCRNGYLNTTINLPMALALVPLSAYGAGAAGHSLVSAQKCGKIAQASGKELIDLFDLKYRELLIAPDWFDSSCCVGCGFR